MKMEEILGRGGGGTFTSLATLSDPPIQDIKDLKKNYSIPIGFIFERKYSWPQFHFFHVAFDQVKSGRGFAHRNLHEQMRLQNTIY